MIKQKRATKKRAKAFKPKIIQGGYVEVDSESCTANELQAFVNTLTYAFENSLLMSDFQVDLIKSRIEDYEIRMARLNRNKVNSRLYAIGGVK